ncbi:uncharacterized protein MELLADRAFT_90541 [Melampsora larici-populina 98AG31]|uniref:UspA domain-containing protein n=1 Tax=Melampsora larici-populina (strain 98AG31 / pathotype 3-4-7) TaxID=747676 RepID=F4RX98_MELLP|nr:uncharacterized protein MELLADRAFT_90541 [Melampsora larici-populina 98AG31]EGG03023.1 hypothetical protein MELLADRAFT_90541 [Melampsora larici-populina 98AG31]
MKGLFHKRVPSFTFTSFNWSKDSKHSPSSDQNLSLPSSPQPQSNNPNLLPPDSLSQSSTSTPSDQADKQIQLKLKSPSRGRRSRTTSLADQDQHPSQSTSPHSNARRRSVNDLRSDSNQANQSSSRRGRSSSTQNLRRRSLLSIFTPTTHHRQTNSSSRSPSPGPALFRFKTSSSERIHSYESDGESMADVVPENAFNQASESDEDSSGSDRSSRSSSSSDNEEEEDEDEEDDENTLRTSIDLQTILANTNANASSMTPTDYLQHSDQPIPFIDQAPNLTIPPPPPISFASSTDHRRRQQHISNTRSKLESRKPSTISRSSTMRRKKSTHLLPLPLNVSRPSYEKNRCTVTIEHGNQTEASIGSERTRFYLVACDLSEESKYAIEWTIGTVLRQGDECLIINIIETETKFDPEGAGTAADRMAKIRNQKDRQERATQIVREATALLERTKLNVKVTCQAVHAKNSKHMLIDCIDFIKPNLVIVGSRGLSSIKGVLMGSVSHYLVQKSSVPVMVARRRLRAPIKVYKKKSELDRQPRMRLDQAVIEKETPSIHSMIDPPHELEKVVGSDLVDGQRVSVDSEVSEKLEEQGGKAV